MAKMTETDDVGGCNCGADIRPSKKWAPESMKKKMRHSLQKTSLSSVVIINNVVMITTPHWRKSSLKQKMRITYEKKPSLAKRPYHCDHQKISPFTNAIRVMVKIRKNIIRQNDNSHQNHNITLTKKPTSD
jgi:hypothetical protein